MIIGSGQQIIISNIITLILLNRMMMNKNHDYGHDGDKKEILHDLNSGRVSMSSPNQSGLMSPQMPRILSRWEYGQRIFLPA